MEFLCYHRDRPDSTALRDELLEDHWSYMDGYAKEMIARGPTLTDDRETATGSVHILDLPDPATARAFAFDEPGYQAGVYRDVLLRRWRNTLGRTMWEFPGGPTEGNGYLVIGLGAGEAADLALPARIGPGDLIAYGPLLADDGDTWLGTAALLRAADPDAARAVLTTPERYAGIEVHNWQFGGRS
ncbi:YciI family protein [Streptomyces sp. WI04-05B]|uniref:YciI family protein n=1 Tax=Streptomyces TaxID=1883 RepID=UPI0029A810BE|nr:MULTISPECIES: YciI family protein [unclassified Streptomyces]MDX2542521.1 YciI family protein [Streptomyces sp. WI04-05B]MDX2582460.1 YciI family protein [Streptomyces sp. WI04-05A]MDX3747873.1 YciI family protein [Streptomyces sp. AK08-02]